MIDDQEVNQTATLDPLFEPFELGSVKLRNRIAMAPMTRAFARNGVHDPDAIQYYGRRAEDGVGLIISEGSPPPHPTAPFFRNLPALEGDEALAAWKSISDTVSSAGGQMLIQLWHAGLQRTASESDHPDLPSIGPSGHFPGLDLMGTVKEQLNVADSGTEAQERATGKAMSQTDIDSVIDAFARAAETVQKLGFAGVEIHAAHGYLFDQFFWDETNQRTDKYGGDIAQRTRLAVETIEEIRRRTGPDFLISFRFSQFKPPFYNSRPYDSPKTLEKFLAPIIDAGVDVFHPSTRRFWLPEYDGSDLSLAGWTKKITGSPTIAVGSVGLEETFDPRKGIAVEAGVSDLNRLVEMLDRGDFDIVAVGRSLLANPDWVSRVRESGAAGLKPYTKDVVETLF